MIGESQFRPIEGRIIEIRPGSAYEERIYDQWVVARLKAGAVVRLFDSWMIVKPSDVGQDLGLRIRDFGATIERISLTRQEVLTESASDQDIHVYGRVARILNWEFHDVHSTQFLRAEFVLDVGSGDLEISARVTPSNRSAALYTRRLVVGEFVHAWNGRLDLWEVTSPASTWA